MSLGKALIDKALETRSVYKLAKEIDEPLTVISKMHKGTRPVPPRIAAKVASVLHVDPSAVALAALVDQEDDEDKKSRLAAMLGVPLHLTLKSQADGLCILC